MFCLTFLSSKLYIDYPRKYLCKHKDPITGNSFIVCTIVAHFAEFTVGLMKINSGQLVCLANAATVLISMITDQIGIHSVLIRDYLTNYEVHIMKFVLRPGS